MNRWPKTLWTSFLGSLSCAVAACAQGVFSMDGLSVDTLEDSSPFADQSGYFEAELPAHVADFEKYKEAEAKANAAAARHQEILHSARKSIVHGEWEAASRNIETALESSPDNPYLLKKAALLHAVAGEYALADRYFERYVRLKPDDVDHVAAWAGVCIRWRQWSKAEALLNRAFELSPRNLSAHFQSAVYRLAADRAKPLRPYNWHRLTLAEMNILANWLDADRRDYEKLLGEKGFEDLITETIGPVDILNLNEIRLAARRAIAAKKRSQWQPLRDILLRLHDLGVQSFWVPLNLARAHFSLGNAEEALRLLEEVQQQHPGMPDAWQNAAFVRVKTGDYEKGLADAREAYGLFPKNPEIEFTLICALSAAGKMDECWPLLEQWARRDAGRFRRAMEGDDPFLQSIRDDSRYEALLRSPR